jgi:hypothetical protein
MMRLVAVVGAIALAGVLGAQGPAAPRAGGASEARFVACDVEMDSGGSVLAAWQIEWRGTIAGGSVELVGVEGGAPGVYAGPAYYDPEALTHDRVVLGAFSTAKEEGLPHGKTRVARLHLRVVGEADRKVEMSVRVMAAADAGGGKIEPTVSASLGDNP